MDEIIGPDGTITVTPSSVQHTVLWPSKETPGCLGNSFPVLGRLRKSITVPYAGRLSPRVRPEDLAAKSFI
jgi:hypothetical protein